jgi:hypothetical protein
MAFRTKEDFLQYLQEWKQDLKNWVKILADTETSYNRMYYKQIVISSLTQLIDELSTMPNNFVTQSEASDEQNIPGRVLESILVRELPIPEDDTDSEEQKADAKKTT